MAPEPPSFTLATAAQLVALAPFLWYAFADNVLHFRARPVARVEHALHALLGVILCVAIASALAGREARLAWALLAFAAAGGADEYGYHRRLPVAEADVHAKQHMALLLFLAVHYATVTLA